MMFLLTILLFSNKLDRQGFKMYNTIHFTYNTLRFICFFRFSCRGSRLPPQSQSFPIPPSLRVPFILPPAINPPACGIMGIVQVAWRSTLCPRRSRRRRAVMTCSSACSPSSPSQLIPASRSSVAAAVGAMRVWAPSLELLVMCLAAAPILPFHRCCRVFHRCLPLCFPALQNESHCMVKVHLVCVFFLSIKSPGKACVHLSNA